MNPEITQADKAKRPVATWRLTEGSMLERSVAAGAVYVNYADYTKLEAELRAMTEDRDLWKGEHNQDCPNVALVDSLEAETESLRRKCGEKDAEVTRWKTRAWAYAEVIVAIETKVFGGSNPLEDDNAKEWEGGLLSDAVLGLKIRAEKAEAELASLRASGEKPEDAWKRGFIEGIRESALSIIPETIPKLREVSDAIYDNILNLKPIPYQPLPSAPTDKEPQ